MYIALSEQLKLVGHQLCPYVQRVVILTSEKKIDILRVDIELHAKPKWFHKLSPTGKVPILITENLTTIFDSNVICDYLDEVTAGSLYPEDIIERAKCRSWIQYGNDILNDIAMLIYIDQDIIKYKSRIKSIREKLEVLESIHSGGRFLLGENFYLVDAVYATIFRYFAILELPLEGFKFLRDFRKLDSWKNYLFQRESILNAVPRDYNNLLVAFIKRQKSYLSCTLL